MAESRYTLALSPSFSTVLKKLKRQKPDFLRDLDRAVAKVLKDPTFGKPLRNILKNCRRVPIGSYVLMYEINGSEIRLLDFDHHDRVYKKYAA
jgi:mRNA-degrading endonuclease RelE of RelBE toxin-antitoxin system